MEQTILDNKYILVEKIGSGGTSKVYIGFDIDDVNETKYAFKIMRQGFTSESENEVEMIRKLDHQNIIKIIDYQTNSVLKKPNGNSECVNYIILEYIPNGELFDYIYFIGKGLGEEVSRYVFLQMIDALEYMHNNGVVHRDIKNENILISAEFEIKFADFGFSTKKQGKFGDSLHYTNVGTASYAAPEIIEKLPYDAVKSDIFSLGVSLYIMVTGKMPFKYAVRNDIYYKDIYTKEFDNYWDKMESKNVILSAEFKDLFVGLIMYDPTKRLSLSNIKKHAWVNQNVNKLNTKEDLAMRYAYITNEKQMSKLKLQNSINEGGKQYFVKGYKSGEIQILTEEFTISDEELTNIKVVNPNNVYSLYFDLDNPNILTALRTLLIKEKYKFIKTDDLLRLIIEIEADELIDDEEISKDLKIKIELRKTEKYLALQFTKIEGLKPDFVRFYRKIQTMI